MQPRQRRSHFQEWRCRNSTEAQAFDDITGEELDPDKVHQARLEEVKYVYERGVFEKVPIAEC